MANLRCWTTQPPKKYHVYLNQISANVLMANLMYTYQNGNSKISRQSTLHVLSEINIDVCLRIEYFNCVSWWIKTSHHVPHETMATMKTHENTLASNCNPQRRLVNFRFSARSLAAFSPRSNPWRKHRFSRVKYSELGLEDMIPW